MAAKKRTYASDPLGPAIEKLMAESGGTYRALAEEYVLPARVSDQHVARARKSGRAAGYLNHIVHGNRRVPSTQVITRIGKALGVKPDYFREVRVRIIIGKLEETPALVDRLYKRLSYRRRDDLTDATRLPTC